MGSSRREECRKDFGEEHNPPPPTSLSLWNTFKLATTFRGIGKEAHTSIFTRDTNTHTVRQRSHGGRGRSRGRILWVVSVSSFLSFSGFVRKSRTTGVTVMIRVWSLHSAWICFTTLVRINWFTWLSSRFLEGSPAFLPGLMFRPWGLRVDRTYHLELTVRQQITSPYTRQ